MNALIEDPGRPQAIGFSLLLLLCSGMSSDASAETYIAGDDLTRLMMPYLDVDTAGHGKLVPTFLERRKLVIPVPALFVFFSSTGCMTAAVEGERLAVNDDQCLQGEGLAGRDAFAAASGLLRAEFEDKPALFVFSPMFESEHLHALMPPDQAERIQADRKKLASTVADWQAHNASVVVKQVAVRFQ